MALRTTADSNFTEAAETLVAAAVIQAEFATPCKHLVTNFKLEKGSKQLNYISVESVDIHALTEGIDMTASESMNIDYVGMTTSEYGAKIILTDVLMYESKPDMFGVAGKVLGNAEGRYVDESIIALFSGLNGGVDLGAAGTTLTGTLLFGCIAHAGANKFQAPVSCVVHPNQLADVIMSSAVIAAGSTQVSQMGDRWLQDWNKIGLNGVLVIGDGNIPEVSGDDYRGAIFSRGALGYIDAGLTSETERDASLRAQELVVVRRFGVFELEDDQGAPMLFDATAPATGA